MRTATPALSSAPIALLTDARFAAPTAAPGDTYFGNILEEDRLLAEALLDLGIKSVRVNWADPSVEWGRFRGAVFRTTWDYFERIGAFRQWLLDAERETLVLNPPELIRWNLDKHYLKDLEAQGLPVVPTRVLEVDEAHIPLRELLDDAGWSEGVVKPCISGGARLTFRVSAKTAQSVDTQIGAARKEEAFLLQPFLPAVLDQGEVTLVVFEGRVTHAVRKRAKPGDFRVQDDHGGTVHAHDPLPDERALAEAAFASLRVAPAYGRVDLVRDPAGTPRIMELELIEPELWLRLHPPAAHAFASAIAARLP